MRHPSFSIVVPIYGVEKYIERCATSLFQQDYDRIQFIFVNDGTRDCSMEVLRTLIDSRYKHLEPQITIVNKKNAGLPAARKTGVEHATGDYILHVDSDDYINVCTVRKIAEASEKTDADFIYFNIIKEYPRRRSYKRETDYDTATKEKFLGNILRGKSFGFLVSKCFKRSVYESHHIYYAPYGVHEDIYCSAQLIAYSNSVYHLDEYLYHYDRSNPEAHTAKPRRERNLQSCANMLDLFSHFCDDIEHSPLKDAAPSMMFLVALRTIRYHYNFFQSHPWLAEYVYNAPLSTHYCISLASQLFVKTYIWLKFKKTILTCARGDIK